MNPKPCEGFHEMLFLLGLMDGGEFGSALGFI